MNEEMSMSLDSSDMRRDTWARLARQATSLAQRYHDCRTIVPAQLSDPTVQHPALIQPTVVVTSTQQPVITSSSQTNLEPRQSLMEAQRLQTQRDVAFASLVSEVNDLTDYFVVIEGYMKRHDQEIVDNRLHVIECINRQAQLTQKSQTRDQQRVTITDGIQRSLTDLEKISQSQDDRLTVAINDLARVELGIPTQRKQALDATRRVAQRDQENDRQSEPERRPSRQEYGPTLQVPVTTIQGLDASHVDEQPSDPACVQPRRIRNVPSVVVQRRDNEYPRWRDERVSERHTRRDRGERPARDGKVGVSRNSDTYYIPEEEYSESEVFQKLLYDQAQREAAKESLDARRRQERQSEPTPLLGGIRADSSPRREREIRTAHRRFVPIDRLDQEGAAARPSSMQLPEREPSESSTLSSDRRKSRKKHSHSRRHRLAGPMRLDPNAGLNLSSDSAYPVDPNPDIQNFVSDQEKPDTDVHRMRNGKPAHSKRHGTFKRRRNYCPAYDMPRMHAYGPQPDHLNVSDQRHGKLIYDPRELYTRATVIPMTASGLHCMAMADSGATITVISKRLANWVVVHRAGVFIPGHEKIEVFEGGVVTLKKQIEIDLVCYKRGGRFIVWVSESDNLPFDICLGDDVLNAAECNLDWPTRQVRLFNEVTTRMTRMMIDSKNNELDKAFAQSDFHLVGEPDTTH